MSRPILLLSDYHGEYWVRHKHTPVPTDLSRLGQELERRGYTLRVQGFGDVDFRNVDYRDQLVLYQSSQDPGLLYQSYIEDVVRGLELAGAKLIPRSPLLRAHHNKVFLEILRDLSGVPEVKTLSSRRFGTYEDFLAALPTLRFPSVLKLAQGDSAEGVALLEDFDQARRVVRKLTLSFDADDAVRNVREFAAQRGRRLLSSAGFLSAAAHEKPARSLHRRKFVVQDFVPGLDHDWKTLAFGDKLFVSVRPTRQGDFRASGSPGARSYPTELPRGLLPFLERVFRAFRAPFASIDTLYDGTSFYLGEIQFVRFGTGALIRNPHHWKRGTDGEFERVQGRADWETEFAEAVALHIEREGM